MSQVVRVDLREATLSESASLTEGAGDQPSFIGLDNPPPVRSLLRVHVGEEVRAFEVGRVIEVVDEVESKRGCYGRFIGDERLAEQNRVGSEHLEPGISGGVPAPVVIMNTGDMMLPDLGDEGEGGDAGPGESSDAAGGGDEAEGGTDEAAASEDAPASEDVPASDDAPASEDAPASDDAPASEDAGTDEGSPASDEPSADDPAEGEPRSE